MRAVLLVAMLLSGCMATSFEARFDAGLQPAFMQGSPSWRDPGLYDALPESGNFKGFDVATGDGPPMVSVRAPGEAAEAPTVLSFRNADLDEAWGSYRLQLVRWRSLHEDPRLGVAFHLDRESLQGWIGEDVGEARVRSHFRDVASSLLAVTHAELDEMEERFIASRRDLGLPAPTGHGTAAGVDGVHHIVSYFGPTQAEDLFAVLGGLPSFTSIPRHQALLLPSPGQLDLVHGPWEFVFDTSLKTATRGPFADTHGVLVTPDDSVLYAHWGKEDLRDGALAQRLQATMRLLGREAPDASGWEFTRQRVEGGPG